MENINQKLEFLIRAITDSLSDRVLLDDFFKNQKYPLDDQLLEIMSTPVPNERLYGLDWPERAHTMIGIKRMKNLMECLDYIRENKIEGDFIETGVWRGGASIFMKKYSDLICHYLQEMGYTHCFFVAGGNIMHLIGSASEMKEALETEIDPNSAMGNLGGTEEQNTNVTPENQGNTIPENTSQENEPEKSTPITTPLGSPFLCDSP
jgi:hypothetical protein